MSETTKDEAVEAFKKPTSLIHSADDARAATSFRTPPLMLRSSLFLGRRAFSRGSLATPPAPFLTLPKTAAIVGAPFNLGQPLLGVEAGPNAVRQVRTCMHVQTACGGQWRPDRVCLICALAHSI